MVTRAAGETPGPEDHRMATKSSPRAVRLAGIRRQLEDARRVEAGSDWRQRVKKAELISRLSAAEARCRPPARAFDPDFEYPF